VAEFTLHCSGRVYSTLVVAEFTLHCSGRVYSTLVVAESRHSGSAEFTLHSQRFSPCNLTGIRMARHPALTFPCGATISYLYFGFADAIVHIPEFFI